MFPYGGVSILAEALVVEAVHLGDLSRFVVAAQDGYSLTVSHLTTKTQIITEIMAK